MKRNCNYCRALEWDGSCNLRYENEVKTVAYGIPVEYKPLELCPKPTTYNELISLYGKEKR
jgi:hypothetical protein